MTYTCACVVLEPPGLIRHCSCGVLMYKLRRGLWREWANDHPHTCKRVQAGKGRTKERTR